MHVRVPTPPRAVVLGAALMSSAAAFAAGGHGHGDAAGIGTPGDPASITRTVEVTLADIRFEPERITVAPGETVRFVLTNTGELLHEFNIGTAAMHRKHQAEMIAMMDHAGHAHDHPNSVLLEPGRTGELIWTFGKAAELEFACDLPGHYEAGMAGEIAFED